MSWTNGGGYGGAPVNEVGWNVGICNPTTSNIYVFIDDFIGHFSCAVLPGGAFLQLNYGTWYSFLDLSVGNGLWNSYWWCEMPNALCPTVSKWVQLGGSRQTTNTQGRGNDSGIEGNNLSGEAVAVTCCTKRLLSFLGSDWSLEGDKDTAHACGSSQSLDHICGYAINNTAPVNAGGQPAQPMSMLILANHHQAYLFGN